MAKWDDLLSKHDREVMAAGVKIRKPTGFGERPALLVIDMNIGAVGEDRPIYEQLDRYPLACGPYAWAAIRQIQKLLPVAREAGIPIIYSKHIFKASHGLPRHDDPTYSFSELSPLSEFHPETFPQEGDLIIEKQRASVFFQTPLLYVLQNQQVDTLIIVGNSTSGCVRATTVDASYYPSFKVSVVEECVFDRVELSHKAGLFDIQFKYGDLVSLNQAIDYLEQIQAIKAETARV